MVGANELPYTYAIPFSGTCVQFHPFLPHVLAVGAGRNFGIAGGGSQHVISIPPLQASGAGSIPAAACSAPQTVLDCAWCESNPTVLCSALGNGEIFMWDFQTRAASQDFAYPVKILRKHTHECCSLDWNIHNPQHLLSASWDMSVCIWDTVTGVVLNHLPGVHQKSVQRAAWSPTQGSIFATGGGDGSLKILDTRTNLTQQRVATASSWKHSLVVLGHQVCHEGGELLSLDWNKYQPFIIATSGTEPDIRLWDIRKLNNGRNSIMTSSVGTLTGHQLPVRILRWSPFRQNIIASGSYDMSVNIWDTSMQTQKITKHPSPHDDKNNASGIGPILSFNHHSEFVIGLDWNLFHDRVLASTSWDRSIRVWDALSAT